MSDSTVHARPMRIALSDIQPVTVTVSTALALAVTIPPPAAVAVDAVAAWLVVDIYAYYSDKNLKGYRQYTTSNNN